MNVPFSSSEALLPTAEELFPDTDRLGTHVMDMMHRLVPLTDVPGQTTRLYLSPAHRKAVDVVSAIMAGAGMSVRMDAAGSLFGRYEAARPGAPTLLVGSHLDSVVDGGNYDGPLGVMCAVAVVEQLSRAGVRLPFAIEVCAFGDEENVRFPTHLSTSNALAGEYLPDWLDCRDEAGTTLREALLAFGGDPEGIAALRRRPEDLLGYLEVHIEQGPVLEAEELPVGIVTAIAAMVRAEASFSGRAGHAGTVPMAQRADALVALGEAAVAVDGIARGLEGAVATIGKVAVLPGAPNVIPARAAFTLDARAPDDAVCETLVARIRSAFEEIAARRRCDLSFTVRSEAEATPMDPRLIRTLAAAVEAEGHPPRQIASGAGHDAGALARITPAAMIFVRCENGISHSPLEKIMPGDAAAAVRVLYRAIRQLALDPPRANY